MIIMVTGGRDYADSAKVVNVLGLYAAEDNVLVCGGAPGLDTLAFNAWTDIYRLTGVKVPADWEQYKKAAGPIRNERMVSGRWLRGGTGMEAMPDLAIAFPGGRGTADATGRAKAKGIDVVEIT